VLGRNDPGRNDPEPGADRPSTWGGTTAFGADVGRMDPGGSTVSRDDERLYGTEYAWQIRAVGYSLVGDEVIPSNASKQGPIKFGGVNFGR